MSGTPKIDLDKIGATAEFMRALAGEDIVSKTGTEHLKGTKFSLDRTPAKEGVKKP